MERVEWDGRRQDELVERAARLLRSGGRKVLGIAGAPASGKSTLSLAVVNQLELSHPGAAVLVGMDAFHIGHRILERRGLVAVKGASHTFDVAGYVAFLERLRRADETVYAPEFRRDIEDSLAHTVEVEPTVRLVVTEGNYLLLPQEPWRRVRPLLDEAWFVHLDDEERRRRMVARHQRYGHPAEVATARAYGSDEVNSRLVGSTQQTPDVWIEQHV